MSYSNAESRQEFGQLLTSDIWTAIVTRATHDAAFGTRSERTSARNWLAKHFLPLVAERPADSLDPSATSYGEFFARLFEILRDGNIWSGSSDEERKKSAQSALSLVFGKLRPEERTMIQTALAESESEEVKQWWTLTNQEVENAPSSES